MDAVCCGWDYAQFGASLLAHCAAEGPFRFLRRLCRCRGRGGLTDPAVVYTTPQRLRAELAAVARRSGGGKENSPACGEEQAARGVGGSAASLGATLLRARECVVSFGAARSALSARCGVVQGLSARRKSLCGRADFHAVCLWLSSRAGVEGRVQGLTVQEGTKLIH